MLLKTLQIRKLVEKGLYRVALTCSPDQKDWYTLFFFIRTSNFDAEAERSYIFWRFEAETFLKMFLNLPGTIEYYNAKLKEYKVNYLDNTSDFVSPDDFDGVEVILEQL